MIFTSENTTLTLSSDLREVEITLKVTSDGNFHLDLPRPTDQTKVLMLKMHEESVESFNLEVDSSNALFDSLVLKNPKSACRLESKGDKWSFRGGVHINLN